jgi:hypothetical protein
MVPIRGRKANCERLLSAYKETVDSADMFFIMDPDDLETYEGVDWKGTSQLIMDPRGMIGPKRNYAAQLLVDDYDALMCAEDDIVFGPRGWDTVLMAKLEGMGGTGMVYPNDDRRVDIPENVLISSDIVKALGWFCEPSMQHYYIDNVWSDIGRHAGCLEMVPEVLFENFHYSMAASKGAIDHDKIYSEAEKMGPADQAAYMTWRHERMDEDVATVKKVLKRAAQR